MEYIGTKIEGKEYQERKTSYGLIFNENGKYYDTIKMDILAEEFNENCIKNKNI